MMSMKVDGQASVMSALAGVVAKVQKRATKKAVDAATKVVLWAAKGRARVVSGLLRRSLGRKTKVYRGSGRAVGIVGPRTKEFRELLRVAKRGKKAGQAIYRSPTQYGHLVDKGTKRSRAFPFMGPALESSREKVRDAMAAAVASVIEGQGGGE